MEPVTIQSVGFAIAEELPERNDETMNDAVDEVADEEKEGDTQKELIPNDSAIPILHGPGESYFSCTRQLSGFTMSHAVERFSEEFYQY